MKFLSKRNLFFSKCVATYLKLYNEWTKETVPRKTDFIVKIEKTNFILISIIYRFNWCCPFLKTKWGIDKIGCEPKTVHSVRARTILGRTRLNWPRMDSFRFTSLILKVCKVFREESVRTCLCLWSKRGKTRYANKKYWSF